MSWISKRFHTVIAVAVMAFACGSASASTIVRIQHNLGITNSSGQFQDDVYIELFDDTPATQANFLNYVNGGDYNGVIYHRLVPGFVLQGGGFLSSLAPIPTDPPVVNEFARSNLRGTIAMAKLGGDPNSATNQFFYNLVNNAGALDGQNGGFTVFARVLGNGMGLVDAYAGLPTINAGGGAFTQVPVLQSIDPNTGGTINTPVIMTNVSVAQLRIGDTDLDGDVDQADADLLTTTLVGGTDEPQFDVDLSGIVDQTDLNLLNSLILGDANGDGFVGIDDLNILLSSWNQNVPPGNPLADRTGEGFVGVDDLNVVLAAWNAGSPPLPPSAGAAVPEPTSLGLLALGAASILSRRRQ